MIYSKYSDINALLTKSYKSLIEIEEEYNKSLRNKQIDDILLVDIKNYFENLRSSLDYLWKKISNKGGFPIKENEKDFKLDIDNKNIIDYLFKIQPFKGNIWLNDFSILTNKNKHFTLIPQRRTERKTTHVTHPSGGGVSWGHELHFDHELV